MEEKISNEQDLFTEEEIVKVMEDFGEAVAMDELCCIIYCVATKQGKVSTHVRGSRLNVMLCLLSILENTGITIEDLKLFKIFKDMTEK